MRSGIVSELNMDTLIEVSVILVIGFFCLSTEKRIMGLKKEAEIWQALSL
jgi:hypothetical protein